MSKPHIQKVSGFWLCKCDKHQGISDSIAEAYIIWARQARKLRGMNE